MHPFYCTAIINDISDEFPDTGIVLAIGFDEDHEPDTAELNFVIWCRTLAETEELAHEQIKYTLSNLGVEQIISLTTITTDVRQVIRTERKGVYSLEPKAVGIKGNYIGYKADSVEARMQAEKIVHSAMIRTRWQFWK